ncbi:fatty aldehyde dehydrogenase [Zopfochytrium polystomum]|nr:fatty aldehyde dehydrogenase [Zopfochytrium polystomum]
MNDVLPAVNDIAYMLDHLDEWTQPEHAATNLVTMTDKAEVRREPRGVVLVVSPWNFPVLLVVQPMAQAIGAGNTVVVKPSELATHTEAALAYWLPRILDPDAVKVVCGAVPETSLLLQQRFDHILYTGSGAVGKIVMTAAAKHLTPVVLELGGKSPVYIDKDADIQIAAKRLAWAKSSNAGQICLCPDYALVHKAVAQDFYKAFKAAMAAYYAPGGPQKSNDYARIINARHFARLEKLLRRQLAEPHTKVLFGGEVDESDLYMAPTAFIGVKESDPVMEDEIFGPLIGMIEVENEDEVIRFVNKRDHPLAIYLFAPQATAKKILDNTNSGIAIINDFYYNMMLPTLPFGGVGGSGMGSYHGEAGFLAFSHRRATLWRPRGLEIANEVRYTQFMNWKHARSVIDAVVMAWPRSWLVLALSRTVARWGPLAVFGVIVFWLGRASK